MDIVQRLKDILENDKLRMPSIVKIHELLDERDINHWFHETRNTVEYRSKGNRYVNSRHEGKSGYEIEIRRDNDTRFTMDTSDSYYSWNKNSYCRELLEILGIK